MAEPLYISKDRLRVGTIGTIRAYEAGIDALAPEHERAIIAEVEASEALYTNQKVEGQRCCVMCDALVPVIIEARETYIDANSTLAPRPFYRRTWERINEAYVRAASNA